MAPVRAWAHAAGRWTRGASRWPHRRRKGWLPCSSPPRPQPSPLEAAAAATPSSSISHLLQPQLPGLSPKPHNTQGRWPLSPLSRLGSASQRATRPQDRATARDSPPIARAGLPTWLPTPAGPLSTSVVGTTRRARRRPQSRAGTRKPCGTSTAACDCAGPAAPPGTAAVRPARPWCRQGPEEAEGGSVQLFCLFCRWKHCARP